METNKLEVEVLDTIKDVFEKVMNEHDKKQGMKLFIIAPEPEPLKPRVLGKNGIMITNFYETTEDTELIEVQTVGTNDTELGRREPTPIIINSNDFITEIVYDVSASRRIKKIKNDTYNKQQQRNRFKYHQRKK